MKSSNVLFALLVVGCASQTPAPAIPLVSSVSSPRSGDEPPAVNAITEGDLRRDMFVVAGDAMRGREAGTIDELRASMWLADRAREAGLRPAGDNDTYFQWWSMRRTRPSPSNHVTIGGHQLELWYDVAVTSNVNATVDLPIVWIGDKTGNDLSGMDLTGKAVAATVLPLANPPAADLSLRNWRYSNAAINQRANAITQAGAAAVILVNGDTPELEAGFNRIAQTRERGSYTIDSVRVNAAAGPAMAPQSGRRPGVPVVWLRHDMEPLVRADGARFAASLSTETFVYPSVNIVAKVVGADPQRRGEYVLFSGHQDHDGVRYPAEAGDSIYNGADDNASVAVAMLAIGRAVASHPMARSALFVWHGAEERGLLGSTWHARHPVVPKASIVAVINGDMIGRNNPDSAALLGVQPPHLNSRELAAAAFRANDIAGKFIIDTTWDRTSHPEGWYFRSDHLPYAREGIPAIMFSTLLHPDYHTPRDNPDRIDIVKLARMTKWMYTTGWIVGNAKERPTVVSGFKLER